MACALTRRDARISTLGSYRTPRDSGIEMQGKSGGQAHCRKNAWNGNDVSYDHPVGGERPRVSGREARAGEYGDERLRLSRPGSTSGSTSSSPSAGGSVGGSSLTIAHAIDN